MSSLDEANRFVNCVMNRTRNDTVMHGKLVILLAILPLIAMIFGSLLLSSKGITGKIELFLVVVCLIFLFYSEMLVVYHIYRRLIDHSSRDRVWRNSLICYAREYGCDVQKMIEIDLSIKHKEKTRAEWPAIGLIILLFVCIMVFMGYPEVFDINTENANNVVCVMVISILLGILMFLFVMTYLIKQPYVHESNQRRFTEELAAEMEKIGLYIPVLPMAVKNTKAGFAIVFIVITFGMYIFVMLYRTFTNTNYHIMNQWDYEVKLMNIIVENEGGSGILPNKVVEANGRE